MEKISQARQKISEKIQLQTIPRQSLKIVTDNPSAPLLIICKVCGQSSCVASVNITHIPTSRTWDLDICDIDFADLQRWAASRRLRREMELQEACQ